MLKDNDRIFKNLYNDLGWDIDSAILRGDWKGTQEIIKKGISICSYLMASAPLILFGKIMYDELITNMSFVKITLLLTLIVIFIKYGLRLIKIVYYQNKNNKLVE